MTFLKCCLTTKLKHTEIALVINFEEDSGYYE